MSTPITTKQRLILDNLIYERLSSNPDNKDLVKGIVNKRNPNLVKAIKSERAWQEDQGNITAYFLVKNKKGTILSFFALRCGEVFQTVNEKLIELAKRFKENEVLFKDPDIGDAEKQRVVAELAVAIRNGWDKDVADYYISKSTRREKDVKKDLNKDNHHVAKAFSAVELTLFCNNEADGVKEEWAALGLPHRCGISVFWHIIIPIIQSLVGLVGCEYLYLFAADKDADGELVNYYKTKLYFQTPVKLGANKPSFDYECFFLCQRVNELLKHWIEFYENYNTDYTDAV